MASRTKLTSAMRKNIIASVAQATHHNVVDAEQLAKEVSSALLELYHLVFNTEELDKGAQALIKAGVLARLEVCSPNDIASIAEHSLVEKCDAWDRLMFVLMGARYSCLKQDFRFSKIKVDCGDRLIPVYLLDRKAYMDEFLKVSRRFAACFNDLMVGLDEAKSSLQEVVKIINESKTAEALNTRLPELESIVDAAVGAYCDEQPARVADPRLRGFLAGFNTTEASA